MENITENVRKVGRPKKYKTIEEFKDKKRDVIQGLKHAGYFKDYYQQKKSEIITCEYCGTENLNPVSMPQHRKTIKCRQARGEKVVDNRGKGNRKRDCTLDGITCQYERHILI